MPATAYKPVARYLHWIVAVLVIATMPVGLTMIQEGLSRSVQNSLFIFHKNIGVVILLLVVARLVYRAFNPAPPLPDSVPVLQARIAKFTHWALYALLLLMAVSGYTRVVAGGFPIEYFDAMGVPRLVPKNEAVANTAKAIHNFTRYPLGLLILLHVSAAAYHGLIRRDGVFSRMWRRA